MAEDNIKFYDNIIPLEFRDVLYSYASRCNFKIGWNDFASGEHITDPNLHSEWSLEDLNRTKILEFIKPCIKETSWFTNENLSTAVLNLVKSEDVHHIHSHRGSQVVLVYLNLNWRDGWYGETLFFDKFDFNKIIFASAFVPGRIILFDGQIPHTIRPQSKVGPKFRMTLSLFYNKQ